MGGFMNETSTQLMHRYFIHCQTWIKTMDEKRFKMIDEFNTVAPVCRRLMSFCPFITRFQTNFRTLCPKYCHRELS